MSNFLNFAGNQGVTFKDHGTGGGTSFTLDATASTNSVLLTVGGILQSPGVDFSVSGTTITTTSSVTSGVEVLSYIVHKPGTAPTIQDSSVTRGKLDLVSTSSAPGATIKGDGTTDGYIQLNCSQNSHGIKLKSPAHSAGASYTLTFPTTDGNANEFLQTNGSGVMTWAEAGGGILLQIVEMTIAKANGTTTIPFDDTVPTNTEGTEIGSQAITMADDSNKCLIEGQLQIGIDDVAFGPIVAVFRGSTNIGTYDYDQTNSQAQTQSIPIHILDSPATAGSVTYSVRIGVQGSATWRVNFGTSGDDYGGSRKSTLFLKEISA